mmetsp:Transcript_32726/g.92243  ORF Transcript_32726/g.92243 Transcript_32726/m.92243 type:complete len:552 (+) Transcript_32726:54-1709(+)
MGPIIEEVFDEDGAGPDGDGAPGDADNGAAAAVATRVRVAVEAAQAVGAAAASPPLPPPPPSPPPQLRPPRERRPLDGQEVHIPRGARRWWPDESIPRVTEELREDVHTSVSRQPRRNDFSSWQMPFAPMLRSGRRNPICALGECGDPTCPSYRPKRPEVREAVEKFVLEKCVSYFSSDNPLDTYASIGCGLLAQDWILLEKLRRVGLLPARAIFVELRTARPVIKCEGAELPRAGGGINLRQTGFMGPLGPEFAFSAHVTFNYPTAESTLFEFCNDNGADSIFVRVGGPSALGRLNFGICVEDEYYSLPVEDCWTPGNETHKFLFTCGGTGVLRIYLDGETIATGSVLPPKALVRSTLLVGQPAPTAENPRGSATSSGGAFRGLVSKIQVWDHEVDWLCTESMFTCEVDRAYSQMSQWFYGECAIWTFGTLAAYAAVAKSDPRFAADLLVKIDVHDELDGYDDFVCEALAPRGLSLVLGGPGTSWCRQGGGWCRVDNSCDILDRAEEKTKMPWALLGSFPGEPDRHFSVEGSAAACRQSAAHRARRRREH